MELFSLVVNLTLIILLVVYIRTIRNRKPRPISTIGFIAKVPLRDESRDSYIIEEKHCSWRLGLGSCGRVATSLSLKYIGDMLVITQTCEDGDYKEFHYKLSDIIGRVTISYKS
ncbi:hypothetical protein [Providencia phage PSTRCR_120]|uniref:Uncharacterized protein n=1 Tax=Providencia phage PSTRCR_120 TaxID=2800826 RepID=A0A7T6ZM98_9CAUD|nr:hypothetical protein [Providencia phage PSTRCR_120]